MSEIYRGQSVRLQGEFVDINGDPAAPTSVTLTLETPTGTESSLTPLQNPSTGIYYYDYTVGETASVAPAGDWYYRFRGTGALVTANVGVFTVLNDPITGD